MLNSSTVYSSLDCTSGYHHIALSPKAQNKSAFVIPFGKLEFKKVPFCLAQAPTYFQLLYKVTKGPPFAYIFIFLT